MRVFISHSSKDSAQAEEVCRLLEQGRHKCFLAPRDIRTGCEYAEEIINGIDGSGAMLLLLSQNANSSPHVLREVERAVSKKIPIIVYKLEEVVLTKSMEYFLMTHQWINSKAGSGYQEIVSCIDAMEDHGTVSVCAVTVPEEPPTSEKGGISPLAVAAICILLAAAVVIGLVCWLITSAAFEKQPESQGGVSFTVIITEEASDDSVASAESDSVQLPDTQESSAAATESVQVPEETKETVSSVPEETKEIDSSVPEETENATSSVLEEQPVASDTSFTQTSQSTPMSEKLPESTEEPVVSQPEIAFEYAALGDRITFGVYNGQPVIWRVIALSADGRQATVISDSILTMKAFDAAEGGKYNFYDGEYYWNVPDADIDDETQRLIRGDNRWELSNLRTWLNSEKENVVYKNGEPNAKAMSEQQNGYNTEPGFLNNFTEAERSAIVPVTIVTNGTVTTDRVYLLSSEELSLLETADVSKYAKPTSEAVELDGSKWYSLHFSDFGVTDHYWWLRDAAPDSVCECYTVTNSYVGGSLDGEPAGLEGYGVRPVITLDLTSPAVELE